MIQKPSGRQSSAFSAWLRTGKLPRMLSPDGLELKFNPWHDPADGRFTFAGAGRRYGEGDTNTASDASNRTVGRAGRQPVREDRSDPQISMLQTVQALPADTSGHNGQPLARQALPTVPPKRVKGSRFDNQPNPVTIFIGGIGEGLYIVGKETTLGLHAALRTNPVTTVRNAGSTIATMIDGAIAAEDTPARIQVSRAASAVAHASARDIGRVTGTVARDVALAAEPGAAISKTAAMRQLRMARPRTTYDRLGGRNAQVRQTLEST